MPWNPRAPTALSWMGELRRRFKHSSRRLCAAPHTPSDPGGCSVLPGGGCGEHPVSLNIKDVWHGTLKHTSILKLGTTVVELLHKCFAWSFQWLKSTAPIFYHLGLHKLSSKFEILLWNSLNLLNKSRASIKSKMMFYFFPIFFFLSAFAFPLCISCA